MDAELTQSDLTQSERETLKAIYRATRTAPDAHTGVLADALGVAPGTVTATVKKLADRGLVDHRPYRGVELTETAARSPSPRFAVTASSNASCPTCSATRGTRPSGLAGSFEHDLPQEVEDRLYIALDRPATCPHGFPIPEPETAEIPVLPPLYALEPGDEAIVAVPGSTDPAVVASSTRSGCVRACACGCARSTRSTVRSSSKSTGEDRTVGERIARQIFVTRDASPTKSTKNRKETA